MYLGKMTFYHHLTSVPFAVVFFLHFFFFLCQVITVKTKKIVKKFELAERWKELKNLKYLEVKVRKRQGLTRGNRLNEWKPYKVSTSTFNKDIR